MTAKPTHPSGEIRTPADLARQFDVSRETLAALETYADLLRQWQKVQNLIAPSTLDVLWGRHIADSLQLLGHAPEARVWLDLGSGAGFPGMVLAIALADRALSHRPGTKVHLIESTARKCAFLAEVARKTRAPVEIHGERIEFLVEKRRIESVDVVTARALAPLAKLLGYAYPFMSAATRCLFLKGRDVDAEIEEARETWHFDVSLAPSRTDSQGRVVILRAVKPIPPTDQEGVRP